MNILMIDTSDSAKTRLQLQTSEKTYTVTVATEERKGSQVTLSAIAKLLSDKKISPKDLTEIKVNEGPGSYTGIRVGVSIANALAFALSIPVNGKKQIVEPKYF